MSRTGTVKRTVRPDDHTNHFGHTVRSICISPYHCTSDTLVEENHLTHQACHQAPSKKFSVLLPLCLSPCDEQVSKCNTLPQQTSTNRMCCTQLPHHHQQHATTWSDKPQCRVQLKCNLMCNLNQEWLRIAQWPHVSMWPPPCSIWALTTDRV